jgi:hypothetical protein
MEIGVPCIERFLLGSEIALEVRLTLGNDAPTTGIFVEKDSRYFCAVTIAENDFVRGHEQVLFCVQILTSDVDSKSSSRQSDIWDTVFHASGHISCTITS